MLRLLSFFLKLAVFLIGGDVIGKTENITTSGSGFKQTTTPTVGAATEVTLNAAGAPTAKAYAAGAGESYTSYKGGLIHTVSLARGGDLTFGYSNDGAKDLTSATWPAVVSGQAPNAFNIPSEVQSYGHDRAGRVDEISDSSGARALVYQSGRLKQTTWNSGPLAGYKVVKGLDEYGRDTGFTLYRGSTVIHSAVKAPNGVSGEVSELASGALKVVVGRNGARQVTGFQWGNAAGTFVPTVAQRWQRGTAGRILLADSNNTVSAAPTFDYTGTANDEATAFDLKGRRLKVKTAGADWAYQYTNGQITSAAHPTLGSFSYQFDGIGRRKNHASSNNYADLLNRTLDWENDQDKTLKVIAHPDARVWVNGTEVSNFTGSHSYAVPSPGASGGWVPWTTLAVLEGEGDAGANADAKAEQSGAVWVPPVSESFEYDDAGNRESSNLWVYGWNAKNELVRARTKGYNDQTIAQGYDISFDYDAEGRRFKKTINRYQSGQIAEQKVITFVWDGWDLLYERHQLPSGLTLLERKYLWGPDIADGSAGGAGGLLLIRETKGNTTTDIYPLYDGTGHVTALTNTSSELLAEYAYGPFGEKIHANGPLAQSNPWRYATKYFDAETGLYYYGKRYLDPVTGQWLSREPLGESESLNLYSYCHNDPISFVDVLGLAEHGLLYQFFFGLDPITLEPSTREIERQQKSQQESIRFLRFLQEFERGEMDTKEFPLAVKETFIRQQAEINKIYQQQMDAAEALANGPRIRSKALEPPIVSTAARSIGGATTEFNASINGDWVLPTGAGTLGTKFALGGLKTMLPILATGARTEGRFLAAEMQAGNLLNEVSSVGNRYARASLPDLKGSFLDAFTGNPRVRTFKAGDRVYRSPNMRSGALEPVEFPGPWFSTRSTKTIVGTESQSYLLKWENPLKELRVYEFTEDVTVYYGKVANGKGYQAFFPRDVDPGGVLKFIEKWPLK